MRSNRTPAALASSCEPFGIAVAGIIRIGCRHQHSLGMAGKRGELMLQGGDGAGSDAAGGAGIERVGAKLLDRGQAQRLDRGFTNRKPHPLRGLAGDAKQRLVAALGKIAPGGTAHLDTGDLARQTMRKPGAAERTFAYGIGDNGGMK